jgi:WD40 repeat protein
MRTRNHEMRLFLLFGLGLVLSPLGSGTAHQQAGADDENLPTGAVLRLSTDRFRQEGEVLQLAYSDDGASIASISRGAVIVWNAFDGTQRIRLRPPDGQSNGRQLMALAFSPDDAEIAATDGENVYIWDVETGRILLSFQSGQSIRGQGSVLRYSPDGQTLAIGGNASVLLFDTTSGQRVTELTNGNERSTITGICWTADGEHFVGSTLDPAVVVWKVDSGEVVKTFVSKRNGSFNWSPVLSADGKRLIAANAGVLSVWRFDDGALEKEIVTDADFIHSVAVLPDNNTIIVGSQDCRIRFVNIDKGIVERQIDVGLWMARSMAVSLDQKSIAIGSVFPTIRQYDVESGAEKSPEWTHTGHDAVVRSVVCSLDGERIASAGDNKQIHLWDARSGTHQLKLPASSSADQIDFDPTGTYLLSSSRNSGVIRFWDVANGTEIRTIDSGAKRVRAFRLLPGARQLACIVSNSPYVWHSPVGDELLQVWDIEQSQKLHEFSFRTASTESLAIAADGTTLVTGAANGFLHVFDVRTGKERLLLPGHSHSVESLAYSPDGKLLASGSMDQTIHIWETQNWKTSHVLRGHEHAVTSVAFAPDGATLASGSGKQSYPIAVDVPVSIRLWNVQTGEQTRSMTGHNSNTTSIAFVPGGQRLVSAHENSTTLVWDLSQAAP